MTTLLFIARRIGRRCRRLLAAPFFGAVRETRRAWRISPGRHSLPALCVIRYFAPITGALRGLAREICLFRSFRKRRSHE